MIWQKIAIALIPVPAFYLIYYRYFTYKPEYTKQIEAFFSGIGLALIILIASSLSPRLPGIDHPFFIGFVRSALIEKAGAFCIILLLQLYYPNFSVMESILSSMITIDTVEGEQLFGEMAVIGSSLRAETARCVTDCVIAVADRENLHALVRNNTEFALNLLESLAKRVQLTHAALLLLLIGTGHKTDGKKLEIGIDVKKMLAAFRDVDADSVVAMFNTLIDQNYRSRMIKGNFPEPAETLMQKLNKTYKIIFRLRGSHKN